LCSHFYQIHTNFHILASNSSGNASNFSAILDHGNETLEINLGMYKLVQNFIIVCNFPKERFNCWNLTQISNSLQLAENGNGNSGGNEHLECVKPSDQFTVCQRYFILPQYYKIQEDLSLKTKLAVHKLGNLFYQAF